MAKDKKVVGLLKRLSNSTIRGGVESAEFLSSLPESLMKPAIHILKTFGPEKLKEFISDMQKYETNEGPLSSISKKSGILKEYPRPESYKEKVAESAGDILGSVVSGGALGGYKTLKSVPGILGELGGLSAQSLAAPKIQEALPNNQVGQFAGNLLTGLGGSFAGSKLGKSISKPIPKSLPEQTHAQTLPVGSPEWRKQYAQELDLSKRDAKSASNRQNIQVQQQKKISESFPKEKIKPTKVVHDIIDNFKSLKKDLTKEYDEGLEKVFSNLKNPRKHDAKTGKPFPTYQTMNLDKTKDYIQELIASEPKGKAGERGFLEGIMKELDKQEGNPVLLNAFKKRMARKANYDSHNRLYMGDAKNQMIKKVIHSMTEELKEQIPGYREVMGNVEGRIKNLESLEKGVVGDYVSSARKNPSEFLNKIFENPNEEFVDQFKQIISPDLYDKAAQSYLRELRDEAFSKTIRGYENQDARLFALRNKLESRALQHSLPDQWKDFANNTAKEIHVTEMAAPRGDIAINAHRGIEVGDESKLFGKTKAKDILGKSLPTIIGGGIGAHVAGVPGAAAGAALGNIAEKVGEKAKTALQREQMLTGRSPSEQIVGHASDAINKTLPQGIMASRMTQNEELEKPQVNERLDKFSSFLDTLEEKKDMPVISQKKSILSSKPSIQRFESFLSQLDSKEKKTRKSPGDLLRKIPVINPRENEPSSVFVE